MQIGELIRFKRNEKHLSAAKLAELIDVSKSYVYKLEKNEIVPSLKVFSALCLALELSSAEILWMVRAYG